MLLDSCCVCVRAPRGPCSYVVVHQPHFSHLQQHYSAARRIYTNAMDDAALYPRFTRRFECLRHYPAHYRNRSRSRHMGWRRKEPKTTIKANPAGIIPASEFLSISQRNPGFPHPRLPVLPDPAFSRPILTPQRARSVPARRFSGT